MRWLIVILALFGIVVASLALREHYRTGESPCHINDKWDCGLVNKSQQSEIAGVPVAAIGMGGYLVLAALAVRKAWKILLPAVLLGLAFSLYLTWIEAHELQVWCIYCVISLATISLITVTAMVWAWMHSFHKPAQP